MSGYLILNDESLPFSSISECEAKLLGLFLILLRANNEGVYCFLFSGDSPSWKSLLYHIDFEIGKWINSLNNKDHALVVKSALSRIDSSRSKPLKFDQHDKSAKMLFGLECDKNIEVQALGVAWVHDIPALSFASNTKWESSLLSVSRDWQDGDSYKTEVIKVRNVCSCKQIDAYIEECKHKKQAASDYLRKLTQKGNSDFPNLIFCASALKDLRSSCLNAECIEKIIEALNSLNNAITDSDSLTNLIEKSRLNISGESGATMQSSRHARKRDFNHPDLGVVPFEIHVKNFPTSRRMHIYPDYENGIVCIGYFGNHLSTVSDPT